MKKVSHFAIARRRPVSVLMIVLAVCVFGYVSYRKLALTLMPDISYPTLTVRTEYPGTAPQEVETQVSQRLEQELGIIQKLNSITSISKADQSVGGLLTGGSRFSARAAREYSRARSCSSLCPLTLQFKQVRERFGSAKPSPRHVLGS